MIKTLLHELLRGDVIDYGDVPTWGATVGAAVAVLYARGAWSAQRQALELERARDRRETASQAQLVRTTIVLEYTDVLGGSTRRCLAEIRTHNDSDKPIRRVFCQYRDAFINLETKQLVRHGKTEYVLEFVDDQVVSFVDIMPGESKTFSIQKDHPDGFWYPEATVRFLDARGLQWEQSPDDNAVLAEP